MNPAEKVSATLAYVAGIIDAARESATRELAALTTEHRNSPAFARYITFADGVMTELELRADVIRRYAETVSREGFMHHGKSADNTTEAQG